MFTIMIDTFALMLDSVLNFTDNQWIYRANNMSKLKNMNVYKIGR